MGGTVTYKQSFKQGFVYLMVSKSKGWHKIGITEHSPARRLYDFSEAAPDLDIGLLAVIPSADCQRLEKAFRTNFKNNALAPEKWRELDRKRNNPSLCAPSEWYELDEGQVECFLAVAETTGGKKANAVIKRSSGYNARLFKYKERQVESHKKIMEWERQLLEEYSEVIEELREENRTLQAENKALQARSTVGHKKA
jgi:hypothetical protein